MIISHGAQYLPFTTDQALYTLPLGSLSANRHHDFSGRHPADTTFDFNRSTFLLKLMNCDELPLKIPISQVRITDLSIMRLAI